MQKIGFIGLGIMGRPMALNLLRKGVPLMVNDIVEEAVAVLTEAGAEYGDYTSIAAQCPIIFTILPNGPIVDMALFSETGLATHLKPGQIVSDLSSVSPYEARSFGERLERIGVHFVDCPVSGGEPKAMDGTLSFMAGGSADVFEKLKPYYLKMGASAILTGPVGSGCVTKLANQIIVNMNIASLSEALVFAQKAGADVEKVYEAIRGGAAGSVMLDAKAPMILNRDFKPGGRISINRKDIRNVLNEANAIDCPVPLSAQLYEIMQSLKVAGQMEEDHGSIVKYFERLAGVEVRKKERE